MVIFISHVKLQGAYFPWKATAMGKNYINGKTFLEKRYILYADSHLLLVVLVVRYNEDLELEDAIHTTILTLKVSNLVINQCCGTE